MLPSNSPLNPHAAMLPHAVPECPHTALLLFGMRRMAAAGLNDAMAAQAMIGGFGLGFRRPLVLLRAFMAEVARVASVRLLVAPCCCGRMTGDERALLEGVVIALDAPAQADALFRNLLHVHSCLGLLTSAQALHASFADRGMILARADEAG